jgi:hypothetical protein
MIFKKSLIAILTVFVVVICAHLGIDANAQSAGSKFDEYGRWINGVSEPWWMRTNVISEDEAAKARSRWEVIGDENETAEDEWAGDYQIGDLHGAYLRLSRKGSFVLLSVYSCEASVTDVDYGRASVTPDLVELFSERAAAKHAGSHSHSYRISAKRFVPVKWDTQYFLVPEKAIARFAEELVGIGTSAYGSGGEFVDYFWKFKNRSRPVSGLPVFPAAYQRYMRKPVDAEIVKLGVRRIVKQSAGDGSFYFESQTVVTISTGRKDGVKRGMTLYFTSPGGESFEVNYVGMARSTGVVTRNLDKNMRETFTDYRGEGLQTKVLPALGLGQQVSSSSFRVP